MKVTKIHLDDLYRSYCASHIVVNGQLNLLIASEEKGYPCYAYSGPEFNTRQVVWRSGGGCMSIVPIPNRDNEFLAIQDFYLKQTPSSAKLVWGKFINGHWELVDVLFLPYLHRFDIYSLQGVNYLMCSVIADAKDGKEDWSRPGSIYAGLLPDNPRETIKLTKIKTGLFRNHGYSKAFEEGKPVAYFTADQGVFKLHPEGAVTDWWFEQLLDCPTGETVAIDLDGDGLLELVSIEPFHGNQIKVYHQTDEGYQCIYHYPHTIDFAHTLVATSLCGIPTVIGGIRRESAELFYLQFHDGEVHEVILDEGCGPANLAVVHEPARDLIIAANHTRNEAAVYCVEESA